MAFNPFTNLDWALPADFTARFKRDLKVNLDELVPVSSRCTYVKPKASTPVTAFVQAMSTIGNARTENNGVAHSTTSSPLVDLFFELTPGVQPSRLFNLLDQAWREDPIACVSPANLLMC